MSSKSINPKRLFTASCMALVVTAMTFAIRARLEGVFGADGYGLTLEEIGIAFGPAFYGFTLAMIIGGPLVDIFGMKRIVWLAFLGHLIGIVVTLLAHNFWLLFAGTMAIGIGNGMVEAALNPLVATLYPKEKTKMLNRFHIWFPAGIVIGSVLAYLVMDTMGLSWQIMVSLLFIPLIIYAYLFIGQGFPATERVTSGVSTKDMWLAVVSPLFLFMAFCMMLTASSELGTTQRISTLLEETGASGILVLAFINGIMAVGRAFAGQIIHSISTKGVLLFSAVFTFIGLYWLSSAQDTVTIFMAAGVFAVGVCFFWPTMLGFVAENVPNSGALGLSIMGGIGMFSVSIVLPIMGRLMDENMTGAETLSYMSILPLILIALFSVLYFLFKEKNANAA